MRGCQTCDYGNMWGIEQSVLFVLIFAWQKILFDFDISFWFNMFVHVMLITYFCIGTSNFKKMHSFNNNTKRLKY